MTSKDSLLVDTGKADAGIYLREFGRQKVVMLPDALVDLNIELHAYAADHREVLNYVERVVTASGPQTDWVTKLSAIAGYLGIMVDGTYDAAALDALAKECLRRLQASRVLVLPDSGGV